MSLAWRILWLIPDALQQNKTTSAVKHTPNHKQENSEKATITEKPL